MQTQHSIISQKNAFVATDNPRKKKSKTNKVLRLDRQKLP